jgi:transcriptional regulator with PAS, ATPase and Fis domain
LRNITSRVARSDVGVLLRGESGVGKDLIARELHGSSGRRARPFIKVNCAALPAALLESELFGTDRGAFTDAGTPRPGRFEAAHLGTIFLDEIADLPTNLQAKLLQVLQDHQVTRLGSVRPIDVDVRVIAATHHDVERLMAEGRFRPDVYYRLQVVEIHVPPLRARRDEIPALAQFFLAKFAREYHRSAPAPSEDLMAALIAYHWPGNIRELENMMKRLVVLQDESAIASDLPGAFPRPWLPISDDGGIDMPALVRTAAQRAEREAIDRALMRFHWNRRKAAEHLHVSYKTLLNKIKECGITGPSDASSTASGPSGAARALP